jgi:hypothetical protein
MQSADTERATVSGPHQPFLRSLSRPRSGGYVPSPAAGRRRSTGSATRISISGRCSTTSSGTGPSTSAGCEGTLGPVERSRRRARRHRQGPGKSPVACGRSVATYARRTRVLPGTPHPAARRRRRNPTPNAGPDDSAPAGAEHGHAERQLERHGWWPAEVSVERSAAPERSVGVLAGATNASICRLARRRAIQPAGR